MLAEALNAINALDTLELPSCGIGTIGAHSLASAVDESNFNLLQLNLRGAHGAASPPLHHGRHGSSHCFKLASAEQSQGGFCKNI